MTAATNHTEQSRELDALFVETIDRLCAEEVDRELRERSEQGQWPAALWSAVNGIGLTRCLLPEAAGGSGLGLASAMRSLARTAFHALPLPVAEAMIATRLLQAAGLAVPEGVLTVGALAADGLLPRVAWGADADHLVVVESGAAGEAIALYGGAPPGGGRARPPPRGPPPPAAPGRPPPRPRAARARPPRPAPAAPAPPPAPTKAVRGSL